MNTELSRRMLIPYPEWHKQPFRLSVEEIENPYLALEEFFSAYDLMQARTCLWEWLRETMNGDRTGVSNLLSFYEQIERLTEAAWVLHSGKHNDNIGNPCSKIKY